ncbi:MAG: PAS domain S-box protein [Candidatus Thorarchaeota archaeon]
MIKTEEKLNIFENCYEMITESINELLLIVNVDYNIEYINARPLLRVLGFNINDLIEKSFLDYVHNEDYNEIIILFTTSSIDKIKTSRIKFRNKNGEFVLFELFIKKTFDYSGIEKFLIIMKDLSEPHRFKGKEYELRDSEEKYRLLAENVNDIVTIINEKGRVEYINEEVHKKIMGYSSKDIIGKTVFKLIHPEDREKMDSAFKKGFERGEGFLEVRILKKDGTYLWTETNGKTFTDNDGRTKVLTITRDITDRKIAQERIKKSEEQLNYLISSSPTVIFTANVLKDLKFTFISKNIKEITGYEPQEFIKTPEFWISKVHSEDTEQLLLQIKRLPKKRNLGIEYRFKFKDGIYHWIRNDLKLIKGKKRTSLEIIGSWFDVSIDKIKEERIKYQAELVDHISDAIISTDLDFNIISWNKAAESIYGWRVEEVRGKDLREIISTDYDQVLKQIYDNGIWQGEIIQKQKEGRILNILTSVSLIKDITGSPFGLAAINHDITERKKAEERIRESEEKFRTLAEQSAMGLIIQQNGLIKFANAAVTQMTGYSLDEINRWTVEDTYKLIHDEDLPMIIEKYNQRQGGDFESINQYECRIVTKSGGRRWVQIYTKPINYLEKDAVLSTFIDITVKKQVEEELKEVSRLKSELLSRTSHELKTPLVSIKGYADLLLSQHYEELDFYTISILHEIKQGCSRLEALINDLIETSKLESGEIELIKSEEDLTFLIRFCVKDLKGLLETRNHTLILDIKDDMITMFEKERIYEVIMNLAINAIKYTPTHGSITIKSEIQNNSYVISIKDTGIGLTDEEMGRIFKRFGKIERYGQGLDVISEGSGLGLYISKKIIELHGGNIWVESEGRNKGTTFYFSLPILKR